MPEPKRPLKVFLCHAHADRDPVRGLYAHLTQDGVDAWLDKAKLLPGQDWELEIRKAVREADVVVVCLSKQFNQKGFRQKEVKIALEEADLLPKGEIFIIPARLEECDVLDDLKRWHWVDLFDHAGYEMLMRALQLQADKVGATLQVKRSWLPKIDFRFSKIKKSFIANKPEEIEETFEIPDDLSLLDGILGKQGQMDQAFLTTPQNDFGDNPDVPTASKHSALLNTLKGHTNWVWGVAISPDMRTVVSGSTDLTIGVWDVSSGNLLKQLKTRRSSDHFDNVISVEFNHKGRILASGHLDGSIHLWQVGSWREFEILPPDSGQNVVKNLMFSLDDQFLFAAGGYGNVRIYELNSKKMIDQLEVHQTVAFNSKLAKMASLTNNNVIQVFDLTDKKVICQIGAGLVEISSLALSPDGNFVASGNKDFGIQIWDSSTGEERFWLQGHTGSVNSLEFSPDGLILASGGEDKTVCLWDVTRGTQIETLEAQAGVNRLRFSSDGYMLVAGNGGPFLSRDDAGTVQIWKISKK